MLAEAPYARGSVVNLIEASIDELLISMPSVRQSSDHC